MAADTTAAFSTVRNMHAKSPIWKHFCLKKDASGEIVKNLAICNICSADVKYSGGTTNLTTHMRRHHPATAAGSVTGRPKPVIPSDKPQSACAPMLKFNASSSKTIAGFFGATYSSGSLRAMTITDKIGRFIAKDLRPYTIVESKEFIDMTNCLDPRYKVPSRKQFSEIVIPRMYAETKQMVMAELAKAEVVALWPWNSNHQSSESYMTVTSVHISQDWDLMNFVLQTRALPDSHTGEHVAQVLSDAVKEWNIPTARGHPPLVTDNASNMLKAALLFETSLHVPCYAHTINLACQKSLKIKRMSNLLASIRKIVSYFHRSNTGAALLKSKAELLSLPANKLIIDVCTRWNSTHDMVDRFLEMQIAVFAVLRSKELSKDKRDFKSFSDDDITLAEDAVKLLKPLKDITVALCSEKTPTVSYIMPLQHKLLDQLCTSSEDDSPTIRDMKTSLSNDLKNRYTSQQDILNLCSALDPRFKLVPYLSEEKRFEVFTSLANKTAKLHNKTDLLQKNVTNQSANTAMPALPELPTLDVEPTEQLSENSESNNEQPVLTSIVTPSMPSTSSGCYLQLPEHNGEPSVKKIKREKGASLLDNILGDLYVCGQEPPKSPHSLAEDEVKRYRSMPSIPLSDCPLTWWKTHQMSLPLLSRLARQYLCIPATSVPSERVFSTAGDIVTAQRSALKAKHVDRLVFLKKNLK